MSGELMAGRKIDTDNCELTEPAMLEAMPRHDLHKRAQLGTLPDWLSPESLTELWQPYDLCKADPTRKGKRAAVIDLVANACIAGELGAEIAPAREVQEQAPSGGWALPFGFRGDDVDRLWQTTAPRSRTVPAVVGIHRDQVRAWLAGVPVHLRPHPGEPLMCWIGPDPVALARGDEMSRRATQGKTVSRSRGFNRRQAAFSLAEKANPARRNASEAARALLGDPANAEAAAIIARAGEDRPEAYLAKIVGEVRKSNESASGVIPARPRKSTNLH
tara:strand:+ start:5871 stop:6695 length:825 start_codon:yes stop_codon:yes gene_type:complete